MKKLNILQVFMILFCTLVSITSCTKENIKLESPSLNKAKSFQSYINEANSLKNFTVDLFSKADKSNFKTSKEIEDYLFSNIEKSEYSSIEYLDTNFYLGDNNQNRDSEEEISIEDTGLSQKTIDYFNQLDYLNTINDYSGMVSLLNQYKSEYDTDPHLESLAGVFSIIEVFQVDLLNRTVSRSCEGDGGQLASAAIGGAILGARVGFLFGSFLGPAGSAAGTIGGAIVGGVLSGILNIGAQAISNCGGGNDGNDQ